MEDLLFDFFFQRMIAEMKHEAFIKWVNDCCLMPREQSSYIMAKERQFLMRCKNDVCFDQHAEMNICIVLVQCNYHLQTHVSLHSYILSRVRTNQSLYLFHNSLLIKETQHILIPVLGLIQYVMDATIWSIRCEHAKHSTLDVNTLSITLSMWSSSSSI